MDQNRSLWNDSMMKSTKRLTQNCRVAVHGDGQKATGTPLLIVTQGVGG